MTSPRSFKRQGLHLGTLTALGVAQPLYDLLSRYPEFLVAHRVEYFELALLIGGLSLLLPLLAVGLLGLTRALHEFFGQILYSGLVTLLLAAVLLQVFRRLSGIPELLILGISLAGAVSLTCCYHRFKEVRLLFDYLGLGILLIPLWFLVQLPLSQLGPGDQEALPVRENGSKIPIVMVVFDEFPLLSLLDESEQIDSHRFPNFATLAREAYWFSNASTVSEGTMISLPSLVTGRYPFQTDGPQPLPTIKGHPKNLFTLLKDSYRLEVHENVTRLAPASELSHDDPGKDSVADALLLFQDLALIYPHLLLPAALTEDLPEITRTWKDFAAGSPVSDSLPGDWDDLKVDWSNRAGRFRRFIEAIDGREEPTLFFLHSMLPHSGWRYLPDGRVHSLYERPRLRGAAGMSRGDEHRRWLDDSWLVTQAYQRHLLQVGFVDTLVGQLLDRMRKVDLYDRSLILITADHGVSFNPGGARRHVTAANYPEIMLVPLFIKLPHQSQGGQRDDNIETIDVLPTILSVLGVETSWEMDGRSALGGEKLSRTEKKIFSDRREELVFAAALGARKGFLRRKLERFGSGNYKTLFEIGPHPELIGRPLSGFVIHAGRPGSPSWRIEGENFYRGVNLEAHFLPANVTGELETPSPGRGYRFAVALNGTVRAVTQTSALEDNHQSFEALIPWWSFEQGANDLEVFGILEAGGRVELQHSSGSPGSIYSLNCEAQDCHLVDGDGEKVPVVRDHIEGWVVGNRDVEREHFWVGGWVVDKRGLLPVESVVAIVGRESVAVGKTRFERPEAVRRFNAPQLSRPGFRLEFRLPETRQAAQTPVRVFAISKDGVAGELHYPSGSEDWPFLEHSVAR